MNQSHIPPTTPTLENWLWEAACKIRGPVDAPRYKGTFAMARMNAFIHER